jgi:phosphate:Na+ symporter
MLLPLTRLLVRYSCLIIKEKPSDYKERSLKYVDERLLGTPSIALIQVKKEIEHMMSIVEENIALSFVAIEMGSLEYGELIRENEEQIDFTNSTLTKFLIGLAADVDPGNERVIGAYFHVLNDLERIGDHAENFHEIGAGMKHKELVFSDTAKAELCGMRDRIMEMFSLSQSALMTRNTEVLPKLSYLEEQVDRDKRELTERHFSRLAAGSCDIKLTPYYSSIVVGLERVADHLVNVGYSIVDPTGSQRELER